MTIWIDFVNRIELEYIVTYTLDLTIGVLCCKEEGTGMKEKNFEKLLRAHLTRYSIHFMVNNKIRVIRLGGL